mgnify:CR=1 FL=1
MSGDESPAEESSAPDSAAGAAPAEKSPAADSATGDASAEKSTADQSRTEESAADVFGLLSDPIRVDVLRAMARDRTYADMGGVDGLTFSDIYDRVDVDNTSKLSYHLGELTGTFVRKDDGEYTFTHAGEHIVRFILARNFVEPRDVGVHPVDGTCLHCETEALEARINHQFFLVECRDCGMPNLGHGITPAQARDRDWPALVESLTHRQASEFARIGRGHCPMCDGPLSRSIRRVTADAVPEVISLAAIDTCEECLRCYSAPPSYTVAQHPASVAFHWDHGVDITAIPMWEFHTRLVDGRWTSERVGTDPEEYRVVMRADGDELRAYLDGRARVTRTERVRR